MGYDAKSLDDHEDIFVPKEHVEKVKEILELRGEDDWDPWGYHLDEEGNLDYLGHADTSSWHLEEDMAAIAPYVRDGSLIGFVGEDGALFAYRFKGGEVREVGAIITWEDWDGRLPQVGG